MKRLLVFAFLSVATMPVSAQSKSSKETIVGIIKPPTGLKAQLTYRIYGIDTTYNFTFKDNQDKQTEVFKTVRLSHWNDVLSLYELFKSVFRSKNKKAYEGTHYIGTNEIDVKKVKSSGVTYAKISVDNASVRLTEKEIDMIFGKQ
jgi:hypothetical protein